MDNKELIVEQIWGNPAPAMGGEWVLRNNAWQTPDGSIRLLWNKNRTNINVFYNHGSGFGGEKYCDVFTHLSEKVLYTDFGGVLKECARIYGVELKHRTEEDRIKFEKRIRGTALLREVVPLLIDSLEKNPSGEAATYLREVRGLQPDGVHFGELSAESLKRVREHLRAKNYSYTDSELEELKLTEWHAEHGYGLVIPYYSNGQLTTLVYRNTRKELPTNKEGKPFPKYMYCSGLERSIFSDRIGNGERVTIVEGFMDAIRLIQSGVANVMAIGGATLSESGARLLSGKNIHSVTYVPDVEFNEDGTRRRKIIEDFLNGAQRIKTDDGEQLITSLFIAELPATGTEKTDVDSYGKEHGAEALRQAVGHGREWWDYRLERVEEWAENQQRERGGADVDAIREKTLEIYNRCNPCERQSFKDSIEPQQGETTYFRLAGITPKSLEDVDELNRQREYKNRVAAAETELRKAVEDGANPETVGAIARKLSEAQSTNTRTEWDRQINSSYSDQLRAIKEQPEAIRTKWELGTVSKEGRFVHREYIDFTPSDITVFCAPTSHGKTMILMQSAIDMIKRDDGKIYLYVSCEESQRQLLERALNVTVEIQSTPDGIVRGSRNAEQDYCFIDGTRKRAIKAAVKGTSGTPEHFYTGEFWDTLWRSSADGFRRKAAEHWARLSKRIESCVESYGKNYYPRLKLIHTEGSAESITNNIRHYVETYREQGLDVGAVFVDYMQLLTSEGRNFSRHDELKDICDSLKECAQATELPIIIAAQLNREAIKDKEGGLDNITVANIGEGSDIEKIAHDIYLLWQVDKTRTDTYFTTSTPKDGSEPERTWNGKAGERASRIFRTDDLNTRTKELKRGYMYVEQLKARDGISYGWGLFPFDGARGWIGENDTEIMRQK